MKTYIKWMEEPFILAFLDVLVVNAGFLFAFLLRFGVELQSSGSFHAYLTLAPVLSLPQWPSSLCAIFIRIGCSAR